MSVSISGVVQWNEAVARPRPEPCRYRADRKEAIHTSQENKTPTL